MYGNTTGWQEVEREYYVTGWGAGGIAGCVTHFGVQNAMQLFWDAGFDFNYTLTAGAATFANNSIALSFVYVIMQQHLLIKE